MATKSWLSSFRLMNGATLDRLHRLLCVYLNHACSARAHEAFIRLRNSVIVATFAKRRLNACCEEEASSACLNQFRLLLYCSSITPTRSNNHLLCTYSPPAQTNTPRWPLPELNRTHKCPQARNDGEDEGEDAVEADSAAWKTLMTVLAQEGEAEVAFRVEDEAVGTGTAQAVAVDMRQRKVRRRQWS
jgi:hypothetical protein